MRDIKGFEGLYAITSCGKVWSYRRKKFLSQTKSKDGYFRVGLHKDGKLKTIEVHRLVAEAYIDNPSGLPQVNHKDENKEYNCIKNLEWVSIKGNANYGNRNKLIGNASKGRSKKALPIYCIELDRVFNSQQQAIKELGVCQSSLSWALCGKRKTAGGYHWRYNENGGKE